MKIALSLSPFRAYRVENMAAGAEIDYVTVLAVR